MAVPTTRSDVLTPPPAPPPESLDHIVPLVYQELRAIAHRRLAAGGRDGTLATTGLVHEAYLKFVGPSQTSWSDRAHFLQR